MLILLAQSKTDDGFVSAVILKRTDPKTRELVTLPPMKLPPSHRHLARQTSPLEARHFAAAYALFRVCSMRNIHMMMPPAYKKLWKEDFADIKNVDTREGRGWMYEADPFLAKQERERAAAELEKKKKDREKSLAKASESSNPSVGPSAQTRGTGTGRLWSQAPKIEMGSRMRRDVEELLRRHAIWNPYKVKMSERERKDVIDEFVNMGFRRSHVEEATEECKDKEETLEWLLVYVPEDDLPSFVLPEGYSAGVSLASRDLAREHKIKQLASVGYPADLCSRVLDAEGGDELAAAEFLQDTLIHGLNSDLPRTVAAAAQDGVDNGDEVWEEEQTTLHAVFGDRYSLLSPRMCEIRDEEESSLPGPVSFRFQRPFAHYPASPPVISIQAPNIPAYIRLSAIRQAVQHAHDYFLGEPSIYNILDWLQTNMPNIMENPGKLRDISTETSRSSSAPGTSSNIPIRRSRGTMPRVADRKPDSEKSVAIRKAWESRQSTQEQRNMTRQREALPAWNAQAAIIQAVNSNQVTIIVGETGSGKSTQSVQFVLDDMIKRGLGALASIVCTQPRRISALGLADRVSAERCSAVGEEVGYAIRGDSQVSSQTRISFVTTGVLLRRLQSGSGSDGDVATSLDDITHVVVDEIHERSLDVDFLLALLKDVLRQRKNLKVILMSATLDADVFIDYFGGRKDVGLVNIHGRTFPVQDVYLDEVVRQVGFVHEAGEREDVRESSNVADGASLGKVLRTLGMGINYDLIGATVQHIDSLLGDRPGGILIFLPGTLEIDRCLTVVRRIPNMHALPLHASLLPAEQRRVFLSPPKGMRKVVAATNVAETSITIEDVVSVIDTGRVKETSYDSTDNMIKLQEVWASQAACKQRRGRAGRVRAGSCYKLYTRNAEANMAQRPEPEIRRVPLEQLCLTVKAMKGISDVADFLASTITPPESVAVEGALNFLHRVGALDHDKLTTLGRYLSMIPADLRCAKLMIYGSIFGCMNACVSIAAILTVKSPFVQPREKREEASLSKSQFSTGDGDLLTDLSAYERVRTQGYWKTQGWCTANFLSHQTMRDIASNRAQFMASLKETGILPFSYLDAFSPSSSSVSGQQWNRNSGNRKLLRALIAGAFQPQIARISFPDKKFASSVTGTVEVDQDARTIKYFNEENGRVFVYPSSTLFSAQSYTGGAAYLSYFTKMATSKVFIRDLTPFNAFSLLLFCGPITLDTTGRGLTVDGWLRLRGWARIGVLVSRLRLMLDEVLASRFDDPGQAESGPMANIDERVIEIVKRLIEFNGLDQ